MTNYKKPRTGDQQIEYLEQNKRITYNKISKDCAEKILFRYNYINVITPFKHKFALKDNKGKVIKENGHHIYPRNIDFSEYYDFYKKERSLYPIIVQNILSFETQFKAILAYRILTELKIGTSSSAISFFKTVETNISNDSRLKDSRKRHMLSSLFILKSNISNYHDIYCFFDRLTLGECLNIYCGLDYKLQDTIFKDFKNINMHFNVDKTPDFKNKIFTLVSVRNCVMHCNSLEILIRFYKTKNKKLRDSTNRKRFTSMIAYLSQEKDYTKLM